jgi:hypothetical protein
VLTNADKLKPMRRAAAVPELAERLGVEADQVIAVSTLSGDGMGELLDTLGGLLGGRS